MSGESDIEDEAEPDLVVLDPDHPLMKRFQNKLKAQLSKQLEKARLEKKELVRTVHFPHFILCSLHCLFFNVGLSLSLKLYTA